MQGVSFRWFRVGLPAVLAITFAVASGTVAPAADKNAAVTDAALADADFAMQGEYCGSVLNAQRCPEACGLQVVALGNGQFDGVEYRGGLPGSGWDGSTKRALHGTWQTEAIVLLGEGRQITLQNGEGLILDAGEHRVGSLRKVERRSTSLGATPVSGARVLFDGTSADHFKDAKLTTDHLLQEGTETVDPVRDFYLHLEFRTPYMPQARGQGRGNSGVYIQGRYEVQILDSFGLTGLNNECGGLYTKKAPDVNMCLPPLAWQTYDLDFRAARFDASGRKTVPARITAWHNGVVIHNNYELPNKTGAGAPEGPDARPIKLQNHGNPVHFRNIWLLEYAETTDSCFCAAKGGRRRCR